jgi:phage/plasmid-like protein (TIGR03299 family)
MSHNLATINGRVSMAYQGETPWHGLGTRVPSMTSVEQALHAANLNWNVGLRPMFYQNAAGEFIESEFRRSVIRDVDGIELGTVGEGYHTVQNSEAFEILQPACEQFGVTIESAGAIKNGARVWMLAKMPEDIEPVPGDLIKSYFLVLTGHDGTLSRHAKFTPVRVVCKNTLNAATGLGSGKKVEDAIFTVRHSKSSGDRLKEFERMFTDMVAAANATGETFAQLADRKMTAVDVANYIESVFPNPDPKKDVSTILANRRQTVARLVWEGKGAALAGADANGATAWAAYNAVTEYFDHVRPAEAGSESARAKANESAIFGAGADLKLLALRKAAELVTV